MRLKLLILFISISTLGQSQIYQDASQPIDKRLDDLMSQMTLEEKVAQMCQYVGLEHMKKA